MLSKLAVRRLTKLADYMDGLPKEANEHFDMGSAGPLKLSGKGDLLKCGTTACAMGWAATITSFRRAGWDSGWGREERFFDVSSEGARYLFYSVVRTPKQWAKRCRRFLSKNT